MAIFTALASAIGGFLVSTFALPATILGVSTSALLGGGVITAGLFALQFALTPRQKRQQSPVQTYQAVLNQAVGPRKRGYGRLKFGGQRAFWDTSGGVLYQIIMIHHGEIDAIEEYWIGDKKVTLNGSGAAIEAPYAGGYVTITPFMGTPTQAAWADLMAAWPGVWTSDHRLRGVTYLAVKFVGPAPDRYIEIFPEGYNTPVRAGARLSKVLDPRSGVTAWSDNPALCIRDYLLSADGYRLTPADIDEPSFIAFANVCDEPVALAAGGTEPRYRIASLYDLNQDPKDVLTQMLACCDGEIYETPDGKLAVRGGVWSEPTFTITERDILAHSLEQGNNAFQAFNRLRVLYLSPEHDYKMTEADPFDDLADQSIRGVLSEDFQADTSPSFSQARRLAKISRAKRNPEWRGTLTTNLVGLNARSQRIIRVVLPELAIDQDFMVTTHGIRGDLSACEIGISALDASAYAWTPAEEGRKPPPPQDTSATVPLPVPTGLLPVVERRTITADTIATVIVATIDVPTRVDLRLEAQIKLDSAAEWEAMSVATGEFRAISGVLVDGETYAVRARFRTLAATGEWTDEETIIVTANPTAPDTPTGYSAAAAGANANLAWINPDENFHRSRVFRSATNSFGGATAIAFVSGLPGQPSSYSDSPGTGTWYYWVVALNESNVASSPTASGTVTI